jgi:hypothetical protein
MLLSRPLSFISEILGNPAIRQSSGQPRQRSVRSLHTPMAQRGWVFETTPPFYCCSSVGRDSGRYVEVSRLADCPFGASGCGRHLMDFLNECRRKKASEGKPGTNFCRLTVMRGDRRFAGIRISGRSRIISSPVHRHPCAAFISVRSRLISPLKARDSIIASSPSIATSAANHARCRIRRSRLRIMG